jgi:hypothetical protein
MADDCHGKKEQRDIQMPQGWFFFRWGKSPTDKPAHISFYEETKMTRKKIALSSGGTRVCFLQVPASA